MTSRFDYRTLRADEIRLVRVIPCEQPLVKSSANVTVQNEVSLEVQTFSSKKPNPNYTALSYRWGLPDATERVVANGQCLYVTVNLHSFLQEVLLRQSTIPVSEKATDSSIPWFWGWLWIDAICIDQNNVSEKSQQVSRMKEIYENATEIVIWLGITLNDAEEAIETIESLADLELDDEEQGTSFSLVEGSISGSSCRLISEDGFVEMAYTTLFDIAEVLNEEYWSRAWIIQEASTPKDSDKLQICFRQNSSIVWSTYAAANQRLLLAAVRNEVQEHADLYGIANEDIATVKYIQDRRTSRAYDEPLYTMLIRCRTSAASDPRDKVYAILGLTQNRDETELRPDYALNTEEVYMIAARTIISETKALDCLGSAYLVRQNGLPSWVPDWTLQHSIVPQPFYQYEMLWRRDGTLSMRRNLFQAGAAVEPEISFSSDCKQLVARGLQFDTVMTTSTPRRRFSDTNSSDLWLDWCTTANIKAPGLYKSNCSRVQALGKLLRCDIAEVWGDWSAERGHLVEDDLDLNNPFDVGDLILDAMTWNRRLFMTGKEYLGLGPDTIQVGDTVCILFGSQMPVVLRKQVETWLCVGQAYVHGIMDGEVVKSSDERDWKPFVID